LRQGLDVDSFIPTIHGMQAISTIRRLNLPGIDPELEAAAITQAEIDDVEGIEAIPGAAAFLYSLTPYRWAIVTSAPRELALRRIQAAGLPVPPIMIAAEDVPNGKPAPDCFQIAAAKLGTTADKCLVLEDSPAGILAAERAGSSVMIITATHQHPMNSLHPGIASYQELTVATTVDGALEIVDEKNNIHYLLAATL
jgi:sugar-phosphatase